MAKKTVHIVVEDGFIEDAFADFDVDVVVYDLDCPDPEQKEVVKQAITAAKAGCKEIEIL
jgi:hypothetical protein